MKHILSLDIEDFSPVDIKYGVYKRAESGEIILLAYSLDYASVVVLDLTKEKIPAWLLSAFTDPNYIKKAFNAPYERNYLNITLGIYSPPQQWECTQARAAMCGLPLSLDDASKALGLIEKKDPIGKSLIRYFCIPCKPTAANGFRTRNLPEHDPEKWQQFCKYNGQDVVVEQNVDKACQWYKIPAVEHHTWCLNELKNERGVMVDMQLIDAAIEINKDYREELIEEATELTGLSNVNSPKQLKEWLSAEMDEEITSLNKLAVRQMLINADDEDIKRILTIRQLMAKSSITKYLALKYGACRDLRVRGMIQYYGANRTGREAGRGAQPQNFPRIDEDFAKMLDDTREVVKMRDVEGLHLVFSNLSNVLSQLLRPTFVAAPGKEFVVLDFSSIESLASACLAGEQWRIDFFKTGGDIYKASGAIMFHKPVEQITKEDRQKSKVSELLFQYGGGEKAMERNNDTIEDPKKRIPVEEIAGLVKTWRKANPAIVQMWWDMDAAAKLAINTGQLVPVKNGVAFGIKNGNLLMKLPSGRCLVYQQAFLQKFYIARVPDVHTVSGKIVPKIHFDEDNNPFVKFIAVKIGKVKKDTPQEYLWLLRNAGLAYDTKHFNEYLREFGLTYEKPKPGKRETVCFWGMDKIWKVIETYGPKFFENCLARDTKVLTLRGKVCIFEVTNTDKVWDGLEFVSCDGVINNGFQNTISISGVRMTPDHKILTEYGWKKASSCQGISREKNSLPDSSILRRNERCKIAMESTLHLRSRKNNDIQAPERNSKILRVQTKGVNRECNQNSRNVIRTNIFCMEFNDRPVQTSYSSSLAQLRSQGNNSLRKMEKVSRVSGRYGTKLSTRVNIGQKGCEWQLLQGQLPLDNNEGTMPKQKRKQNYTNSLGVHNRSRGGRKIGHSVYNNSIQVSPQLSTRAFIRESGLYEQVYDIVNCGPRNRFVVFDKDDQPFIVHNCVQAACRDLLMHSVINVEKAGHPVVLTVHDELVSENPIGSVSFDEMKRLMLDLPDWCNWPVRADGFTGPYYMK